MERKLSEDDVNITEMMNRRQGGKVRGEGGALKGASKYEEALQNPSQGRINEFTKRKNEWTLGD